MQQKMIYAVELNTFADYESPLTYILANMEEIGNIGVSWIVLNEVEVL